MHTPAEFLTAPTESTRQCRECGNTFELPPFRLAAELVHICPECSERHAEADQRAAAERSPMYRLAAWNRFCPAIFRDTEPSKLPSPSRLQKAMEWQYGARGLVLHGTSGKGKSRIAWELLKREYLAGKSVAVLDSAFSYEYSSKFAISAADAARWVESKSAVDLLLLDDVLKAKLTDSVEQALFTIVNTRTERGLPIITTTNDTGETLLSRMSSDRGPAMLRRLREFAVSFSFA